MATKRKLDLGNVEQDAQVIIQKAKESAQNDKEKAQRLNRGIKNQKKNSRNVFLSDEVLGRLELVKKKLNANRMKGDGFISVSYLMQEAIEFYLDEKYPETKELSVFYEKLID